MNKYLLLRDNKQSGPYSVAEMIEKGIKAYDLVWLEGKSAAWRYPSEIEELKIYSPVVEEQPFDRFYKKPETGEEHSRFVPGPVEIKIPAPLVKSGMPASGKSPEKNYSKKVYINFPGTPRKQAVISPNVVTTGHIPEILPATKPPANETPAPVLPPHFTSVAAAETSFTPESGITHIITRKPSDGKLFYAAIAVCFILVMLVGVLVINYSRQRSNINSLSALVKQLEQREKQDLPPIQTAIHTGTTAPAAEPVLQTEVAAADLVSGRTSNSRPVKKSLAEKPLVVPVVHTDPPIAAREKNTSDPALISDNTLDTHHSPLSENLYRQVSLKSSKFKTGLLGGISNLQIELTNNSPYPLHKVAVEIKYLGPEKKVVKTQTIYFENVSPGGQSSVDVPKSNRGVTIDYTITDIKS